MKILYRISKSFETAFRQHCVDRGVQTVPFWKVSLPDHCQQHDQVELREALVKSFLSDSTDEMFCEQCVPAFLLWVQTQATGHSHHLWSDTVIPLLAGIGDGCELRREQLRHRFDLEHPFRAALRLWLRNHGRAAEYTQDQNYHFWFVRAVIGECALLWVRNDFVDRFFESSLTDWARGTDARARSETRFAEIYGQLTGINREELGSIAALKECLVEAGARLSALAKVACGQLPPAGGWTVDSILERAKALLGITLTDLPRRVVEVLRERLKQGMVALTIDQLVAFFRHHPEAVFQYTSGTWALRDGSPPPVAQGILGLNNGTSQRVTLVDDLGRGPDELLGTSIKNDELWHEQDGIRWRLSRMPFSTDHASRLRTSARPVIGKLGSLAFPEAWVWTGSASSQVTASSTRTGLGPTPFRVFAWPSLDEESLPCLFLLRFRYSGEHVTRIKLISEHEGIEPMTHWSGIPTNDWVTLRCRVPATAGAMTRFSAYESDGTLLFGPLNFCWACPALFADGRRLMPGQHIVPKKGRIVLIAIGNPQVRGGRLRLISSRHPQLGGAKSYEIVPEEQAVLSVNAGDELWRIEPRERPQVRLRLIEDTATGFDCTGYAFNQPGIKVFFSSPPRLTIRVATKDVGTDDQTDQIWNLLGGLMLAIGDPNASDPAICVDCTTLRDVSNVHREGQELCVSLPLAAFAPVGLLQPGLDVRRITICGWLESQEHEDANAVSVSGHAEKFVILPYSRARVLSRMPGRRGGIKLEDASGVYHSLELLEHGSDEMPAVGQTTADRIPLSAQLPMSLLRLETRQAVPLLGAWFWKSTWNLKDFTEYVYSVQQKCVQLVAAPEGSQIRVTVSVGEPERANRVLGERTLDASYSSELPFASILPESLQTDQKCQLDWLSNSVSTIRLETGGEEVGKVELDFRPCVTAFRLFCQHEPTAVGRTTIEVETEVISGFVTNIMFEVVPIRRSGNLTRAGLPLPLRLGEPGLSRQVVMSTIELIEPGEYSIELRKVDGPCIASLDVTARAPMALVHDLALNEFLGTWPVGEPSLANVVYLYQFIRSLPKPWDEFSLYTMVGRTRDVIKDRRSICFRLINILHAFLEDPPLSSTRLDMIEPWTVPPQVLSEVGTVAVHLEFYAEDALRSGLPDWENAFANAARDTTRSAEEQKWLRLLARTARNLTGKCHSAPVVDQEVGVATYFPCRPDFLTIAAIA